jgi:hypothetical protein
MNKALQIVLRTTPEQDQRLLALQRAFAQVCNAIAPTVAQTRIWNRVALHHMVYRTLRAQFPAVGSQMACNAIYAVSRMARIVYQHPASPFLATKMPSGPLPLLHFVDTAPVYFDRHTLSLKDGQLSLFTLDGRMRFELGLNADDERSFREHKLREVVLSRQAEGGFTLRFGFTDGLDDDDTAPERKANPPAIAAVQIPEYVMVEEAA